MSTNSILLVEDEKDLRQAFSDYLMSQGFRVFEASNGYEGLQSFKKNCNDIKLIITDIQMPVMNGYEFLKSLFILNNNQKTNYPKIIVVSGQSPYSTEELKAIGASTFIEKPFSMERILKEIEDSLIQAS